MAELPWVIGILISIAMTVLVAVFKSHAGSLKDTKDKLDQTRRDHSDFRVEVAQKYVSHEQLGKIESRMDKLDDRMSEGFDDIRRILSNPHR